jgi:hypothetical protein
MKPSARPVKAGVYQFIVLPNTGIQICRGFPAPRELIPSLEDAWKLAQKKASEQRNHQVVQLVREHIACNRELEATEWAACDPNEFVFFRLVRAGAELQLDILIDTQNGAGAQTRNKIPILLENGMPLFRKRHHLADIYVEEHEAARNEIGSLIMDFGNSGSAFVFSRGGAGPLQARMVQPTNPFDPRYKDRPEGERNILKSNMIVLRVGPSAEEDPWIVLGQRSEELIQDHPLSSYLHAPKKYVRFWPKHLRAPEPTMKFRGVLGQRDGLHPMLAFVRHTLAQMMQHVLSSLTNPHGTSDEPEFYPQVSRLMLTYPLTWRKVDRDLYQGILQDVCRELFVQGEDVKAQFQVELVCSEPVAVAAYALWESFFHFGTANLPLAASSLGNVKGTPELRLLVVDIGGGSTDIACVDIGWTVRSEDDSVDVTFKMLESMRFNRAGDRLSHIVATAMGRFLEKKYGIAESLDFKVESRTPSFTHAYKRLCVSRLSELAEAAKAKIAAGGSFELSPDDEYDLVRRFEPVVGAVGLEEKARRGPRLVIDEDALEAWVRQDHQSLETNGEPGFMDIFLYLEELRHSLSLRNRDPHLVILSGRSTRLPFIQRLASRHLHLPPHRIRTLSSLLPDSLKLQGYDNMDKLAVVCGAQRFRFGDHIRFASLPDAPIFNRYIGTVRETPTGLKLNKILIRPGDSCPRTITVIAEPARDVRIGHAFREDGSAQVIANLSNNSASRRHEVELNVLDDYSLTMTQNTDLFLTEWVPGGSDVIVDNFNDTGRIDGEPDGFLARIVERNRERWMLDAHAIQGGGAR